MKKTNDLKKGTRVLLAYGEKNNDLAGLRSFKLATDQLYCNSIGYKPWQATIFDNMKGNTRLCEVEGFETELGSVYAHDIIAYWDKNACWWQPVEHTREQDRLRMLTS